MKNNLLTSLLCISFFVLTPLHVNAVDIAPGQCNSANIQTCWSIADGYNDAHEYEQAVLYYNVLCDLDLGIGCRRLGWAVQYGEGIEIDQQKAEALYKKGCDLNDGRSCNNLGAINDGSAKSLPLYELACGLDDEYGCSNAGNNYLFGWHEIPIDEKKGLSMLERGCDLGYADSCTDVADYFDEYETFKKSSSFYKKACDLNDGYGCRRLGWAYSNGEGVEASIEIRNMHYKKACELGEFSSCNTYARALLHWDEIDHNVGKNETEGFKLLVLACEGDNKSGCSGAGHAYENGIGTDKNEQRAHEFYEKGCRLESSTACFNLGLSYEYGFDWVKADASKAKYYYGKACQLGDKEGCSFLSNF